MNLEEIAPAPWVADEGDEGDVISQVSNRLVCFGSSQDHAEFIAMARNAFEGIPAALKWWEANRRKR